MFGILSRHVLHRHLHPLVLGFAVLTVAIELDALPHYAELLFRHAVPFPIVAQIIALTLGFVVVLSAPAAVLISTLVAFGGMAQDNEITALRAGGVRLIRVMVLPLLCAALMAAALAYYNTRLYPELNHLLLQRVYEVGQMRPMAPLTEGEFVNTFPGYSILARGVDARRSRASDLTIYQFRPDGSVSMIAARQGELRYLPGARAVVLELRDGEMHEMPEGGAIGSTYRLTRFRMHRLYLRGPGAAVDPSQIERGVREQSSPELEKERVRVESGARCLLEGHRRRLLAAGATPEALRRHGLATRAERARSFAMPAGWLPGARATPPSAGVPKQFALELAQWQTESRISREKAAALSVEIQRRVAIPFACVVFVLLGAGCGVAVRRGGPSAAFMALVPFLLYYMCLQGLEALALRLVVPVWLATWGADILLGAIGVVLAVRFLDLGVPWETTGSKLTRREVTAETRRTPI